METRRFRAMGTDIELFVDAPEADEELAAAEAEFHRLEAILTRFRPESELSRLNEAGELEAGPELLEVVAFALEARERTTVASTPRSTTRLSPPATTARSSTFPRTARP